MYQRQQLKIACLCHNSDSIFQHKGQHNITFLIFLNTAIHSKGHIMTCTTALDSLNSLSLIFVICHSLIPSLIRKPMLDVKPG